MNYRQQAINLFCSKTSYQKDAIKSCAPIHKGFTNVSYKITLKNHDIFQVRIANDGHQVKRHNEYKVCRMIKFPYFIYYDLKTGNAIKRWIKGSNPSKKIICSAQFLQAFNKSLIKLHDHIVKNNQVLQHDYYDCLKKAKLPTKHRNAYLTLIKKYLAMPLVLSHNDLSADNLIYTPNHEVVFIDYEWARLNNAYWDIANFIREVDLAIIQIKILIKSIPNINLNDLLTFVYLTTNYAYQWTFNMPLTQKIRKYRAITLKKMERYYRFIEC